MSNIFYVWPHDFRWKNNVLGQRLIMLHSLGALTVLVRRSKWLPSNLDLDIKTRSCGVSAHFNEYISIVTYIISVICFLSFRRLFGYISSGDVVYTNFEYSNVIGIWAKEILGLKWVADFFDDPRRGYFNASLRKASKWRVLLERHLLKIYRYFLKKADLVICNSPSLESGLATVLINQFMIEEKNIIAVPGGVHEGYITHCLNDPDLNEIGYSVLREYGLKDKDYIYIVGHINSDVSGIYNVLKAIKILVDEGSLYHLVLAGFCKHKELIWLRSVVNRMDLSDHVHYLGVVDQPLSYVLMKNARICICPYNTNGRDDYKTAYPIKLLEYLTVGVPTITMQTPITEQIVKDFGAGELISTSSGFNIVCSIRSLDSKERSSGPQSPPLAYRWRHINNLLRSSLERRVIGVRS